MIGIVHFGSTKTTKIADCLSLLGYSSKIIDWQQAETVNWNAFSGIILSGAPVLLSQMDHSEYIKRFYFLKNTKIPVLGICFGHQLLGLLFNASVFMGEAVRQETEIKIIIATKLFEGFENTTLMLEDHTEGITESSSFTTLASSEKYKVEAMQHFTLPIFGVQFHPEVSGKNGMQLLHNFCKLTNSI
jgi:GMP synthase (glutamine-hydrolysing)